MLICAIMNTLCQLCTGGAGEMQPVRCSSLQQHRGNEVLIVALRQVRADGCLHANKSWL